MLIRVARVAAFDETNGYALLANASPLAALGGAVYDLLPSMLVVLAVAVVGAAFTSRPEYLAGFRMLAVLVVLPIAFFVPLDAILTTGVIGGLIAAAVVSDRTGATTVRWSHGLLAMAAAGAAIGLLVSDEPWLPAEEVEIARGSAIVGYVLDRDDDVATVLEHDPRVVRLVPTGDVVSRRICTHEPDGFWNNTPRLVDLLRREDRPHPPACPAP